VQQADGSWKAGPGVYLRWCPNAADEGVTAYRIYRKQTPGGPYSSSDKIAEIDNPMDPATIAGNCTMGSQRCEIRSTTCGSCTTPPCLCKSAACTIGPGGTCKTVDLYNLAYPFIRAWPSDQTQKYYYVVTAVRGSEESPYSNENVALPNYLCNSISSPACNPASYFLRFDPDNEGDIACDDEMGSFQPQEEFDPLAALTVEDTSSIPPAALQGTSWPTDLVSPYRVIGAKHGSQGGPAPPASSRWLFYHTDHLGSPRVITDVSGNVVSKHHYMPFGDEKPIATRVSSNAKMFTGHERDIESASSDNPDGLDYMLARYSSSSLGRFLVADQSDADISPREPQSWNRYTYVRNNPLTFFDPTGRDHVPAHNEKAYNAYRNLGYTPAVASELAKGVGEVDHHLRTGPVFRWDIHFPSKSQVNTLVNAAIDARNSGDKTAFNEYRKEALHAAVDMHIHKDVNPLTHLLRIIGGGIQKALTGVDTLNPDSPDSKGYDQRSSEAQEEENKTAADIEEGNKRQTAKQKSRSPDVEYEHHLSSSSVQAY
jgi:RHS repeat-associated protein